MKAPDIDRGWAWVVLFAVFSIMTISGGLFLSTGLLNVIFFEAFPENRMQADLAGTLLTSLSCSLGPIGGLLAGMFSCRTAMLIGAVVTFIGLTSSAFVTTVTQLILTCGFVAGTGLGIAYTPAIASIGFYFERKRDFASGIALAGVGAGLAAFPPLLHLVEETYGWRGMLMILAGIALNMAVFSCLCPPSILEKQKTTHREDLHIEIKEAPLSHKEDSAETEEMLNHAHIRSTAVRTCTHYQELLKEIFITKPFLLLNGSIFTFGAGYGGASIYLPSYFETIGVDKERIAVLISVCGLSNMSSRILTGLVTRNDIKIAYVVYIGNYTIAATCTVLAPAMCQTAAGQVAFVALLGFYSQGNNSLLNSLTIDLLRLKLLPIGYGMEMFSMGTGWLVGSTITGWLIGTTDSYEIGLIYSGFVLLVSALLGMATAATRRMESSDGLL